MSSCYIANNQKASSQRTDLTLSFRSKNKKEKTDEQIKGYRKYSKYDLL